MGALFSALMPKSVEPKRVETQGVISPLHHNANKNRQYSKEEPARSVSNLGVFGSNKPALPMSEAEKSSLRATLVTKENDLTELKKTQSSNHPNMGTNSKVTGLETEIQDIKRRLGLAGGRSRKIKLKLKRKKRAKSFRY